MKLKEKYQDFLDYLKMTGYSNHSMVEYERFLFGSLSHSVQEMEIENLKIVDSVKVLEAGRKHGEYGPQRSIIAFRQLLKYLQESGFKLSFDWRDVRVPKVPQKPVEYLTPDELEDVRNSFKSDLAGMRTRALIEVLHDTGMRISEAISLDKKDIDWEHKEVKVLNAKTKEWGSVYFTDRSLHWLKKYLDIRKDNLDALFVSGRGRLISCTARNYLRTHTGHLGIKKHIKHHIFRKTFVTTLIEHNVDVKSVQTLARHKSERTTLRCYTAINVERAKELHQSVMSNL